MVGVTICEDVWSRRRPGRPQAAGGAEVHRQHQRLAVLRRQAARARAHARRPRGRRRLPVVYVNQVGGQDELVFDGGSMVFDAAGGLRGPVAPVRRGGARRRPRRSVPASGARPLAVTPGAGGPCPRRPVPLGEPLVAESLGADWRRCTRRWCSAPATTSRKNGFTEVVHRPVRRRRLGARGRDRRRRARRRARCTACSCRRGYSSDALDHRRRATWPTQPRASTHRTIPIEAAHGAFAEMLAPSFAGRAGRPDRGEPAVPHPRLLLMALSNKFGWLVLTTGNKSETAVGYSTLYGDTAGGSRGDQGRAQDCWSTSSAAGATTQAGRRGASPSRARPSRPRPSCGPTSATTRACRPTRCSTRSSRATSRATCTAAELIAAGHDPAHRGPHRPPRRPRRVQAPPEPPGRPGRARRRSAATAACRSPTATGRRPPRRGEPGRGAQRGEAAAVTRSPALASARRPSAVARQASSPASRLPRRYSWTP